MRTTLFLLLSLISFAVTADDMQTLLDLEQHWLAAAETHDRAALDALLTDDFTDVSWLGQLRHKADVLAAAVAPAAMHQSLSELTVRVHGEAAVVTGLNTLTKPDGSVRVRLRFTDVFLKQSGRWRAVAAEETPEQSP